MNVDDYLIEGERVVGRYTLVILQQTSQGWQPAMLQLNGITTNYRLILRPLRKKYRPASLPARYIRKAYMMMQQRHRCVGLALITGDWLYLQPSTGSLDALYDDIRALNPSPRLAFDPQIAREDIQRLIHFFRPIEDGQAEALPQTG